ncbi:MAG: glycosyltransferase family 4 protein [Clostridia bacterium]
MNVLLMTLMYSPDTIAEVARLSRDGLQNQINSYQRAFISGIDQNLRQNEHLDILNALPVGVFPTRYRKLFLKGGMHGQRMRELGGVNLPWLKQQGRRIGAERELLRWTARDAANRTVLLYTLYLPYMQAIAAVKRKVPDLRACVIVTDLPNELGISSGRRGLLKRVEYAMGDKRIGLCAAFDGFVLLTEAMGEALPIAGKQSIVIEGLILPNEKTEQGSACGANLPEAEALATQAPAVLYTGTLNQELGIDELLNAFADLPEYELWLCGKGDMETEIRRMAAQYPNIRFYGFVSQEEALRLQGRAAVLINPRSPEGVFTRYSFPSKTLEYLRSGKPVLCRRLAGIPQAYDDYLYYIEKPGAAGIRDAVHGLLAQPPQARAQRGEAGRCYVLAHKNPRVQCERLLAMLRGL